MRKILFIIPYPPHQAPSQRFRFEQYLDILNQNGYLPILKPFLSEKGWNRLYLKGQQFTKVTDVLIGLIKRWILLISIHKYEFVFIHREAAPVGPPVWEWVIAKIFRKKIIYDFDDAIWLTDQKNEGALFKVLKWRSKVKSICQWAYKVSCGNDYLLEFARSFNSNSVLIPTTIDTERHHTLTNNSRITNSSDLSIGWTGSHSTLKYLDAVVPALQELEIRFPSLTIHIIANKKPEWKLSNLVYHPWSGETEIDDLRLLDIGLMPLPDDEWSKGKCGFKALQYLALGIPAIVSPVGVNATIIKHGENGFIARNSDDWVKYCEILIKDPALRLKMGSHGRLTVTRNYSVVSNTPAFLSLFE